MNNNYTIIKEYALVMYDANMNRLYNELKQFLGKKFPDGKINFRINERILFYHDDLDYFVNDDYPGFTLYNLQLILKELDIPNFFCAIITNIPNYQRYTNLVRNILRPGDCPIRAITQYMDTPAASLLPENFELDTASITHPFIFQSRVSRYHRTFFAAKLFEKKLQNKGLISYHNIDVNNDRNNNPKMSANSQADILRNPGHLNFLSTIPFIRYNCENLLRGPANSKLTENFNKSFPSYVNFIDRNCNIKTKLNAMQYQNSSIQKAFLYVAPETTVVYPEPFLTGISFKSIAEKRPFVLFAVPGTIEYLKSLGFKTFNDWWDESYDKEKNVEVRADHIVNIIERLSDLSILQLQCLCDEMSEILDYNYQHLTTTYLQHELDNAAEILSKNIIEH
jgi:hypothetical protein